MQKEKKETRVSEDKDSIINYVTNLSRLLNPRGGLILLDCDMKMVDEMVDHSQPLFICFLHFLLIMFLAVLLLQKFHDIQVSSNDARMAR